MASLVSIPFELVGLDQWVLWKYVNGEKILFQLSGSPAKSNDPTTWASFEDAAEAAKGYEGLGFVFSEDDPYCGIDLDGCRDPSSGVTQPWAQKWLDKFNSYCEVSPSGTGWKIWTIGKNPRSSGKSRKIEETPCGEKAPGVEIYDQRRWFAMTGEGGGNIRDTQEVIDEFCDEYWPARPPRSSAQKASAGSSVVQRARAYIDKIPPSISGEKGHNRAYVCAIALVVGFSLVRSDAEMLFREWNAKCEPPWNEREIAHKLDQASLVSDEPGYLLNDNRDWRSIEVPEACIDSTTIRDAALDYLAKIRDAETKLLTTGIDRVDIAIGGGVEFGEMVLVAARPSHGKSAFALQALDSIASGGHSCLMISEEMSKLAIGKRALQFVSDCEEWEWRDNAEFVGDQIKDHYEIRRPIHLAFSCRDIPTVERVVAEHVAKGVRVVAIDYAQLLKGDGKTRYEQVTSVSVGLRQIASKHGVLLFVLCQLGRDVEKRMQVKGREKPQFIPRTTDLKDSGQLEQDADVILLLAWPSKVSDSSEIGRDFYQVWIGKNRNRAILRDVVNCRFNPDRQKITEEELIVTNRVEAFDQWNEQG